MSTGLFPAKANGYAPTAATPKARICIDPFHVTKLITEAVSEVRIASWRDLKDKWAAAASEAKSCEDPANKEHLNIKAASMEKDYLLVKNSHRLLITSPYSETAYWNAHHEEADEQKTRIFSICPDLKVPYDAIMKFYDITETDAFSDKVICFLQALSTFLFYNKHFE